MSLSKGRLSALFVVALSLIAQPAFAAKLLKRADRLYESGKCAEAVALFEKILADPAQKSAHAEARFRVAYCQFTDGDYESAEKGFKDFLEMRPGHLEAQLRLAETLTYQQDYEGTLELMKEIHVPADQRWIVSYWQGISRYMLSDSVGAEKNFGEANQSAPADSWISVESSHWQQRLKDEYRRIRLSAEVGTIWDGNPAYSSHPPESGGSPGVVTTIGANALLYRGAGWQFNLPVSAYGTFFFNSASSPYDFETLNAALEGSRAFSSKWSLGASLSYQDTRLHYLYNQDSLSLLPTLTWKAWRHVTLAFSPVITRDVVTNPGWIAGQSLVVGTSSGPWGASASVSYSQSFGDQATADPTVADSASGRISSNFKSIGAMVSVSRSLPWKLLASTQISLSRTWFAAQDIVGSSPRADRAFSYALAVSRETPLKGLNVSLSASVTHNISDGTPLVVNDQGDVYSLDYNYVRPLSILMVSYSY